MDIAPTRVVLADSHQRMLATNRRLLEAATDIEVVGTSGDLMSAIRMASEHAADVLVLDLHMLGGSSRSQIEDLRRRLPDTAIVILTMEASPAFVPATIGAGASGYVLKEFATTELADAVRQAAIGQPFISDKLAG